MLLPLYGFVSEKRITADRGLLNVRSHKQVRSFIDFLLQGVVSATKYQADTGRDLLAGT